MRRAVSPRRRVAALALIVIAGLAASCSGDDAPTEPLRLIAYDSFPVEGTTLNDALAEFTEQTGIQVEIAIAGDTGTMVSKAVLTAGNPEGDVMWGVDNTLLSRVLEAEVFAPHGTGVTDVLDPAALVLVPSGELTPVDVGDVCVNIDVAWFAERDLAPPTSMSDLADPAYRDLLVVQDPATSSPGLVFLLASVAEFGEDGWQSWWSSLRDNGVEVVDSWTTAYGQRFTATGNADGRPLVVSYASSPVAEVLFASPPLPSGAPAPTDVIVDTCFRQYEYAGVLRGTDRPEDAGKLLDFLVSERFQAEVPLNLFVAPARTDVALPDVFVEYARVIDDPLTVDPAEIERERDGWIDEWTDLVMR
jgi:thiamine transport system substrate-binding protein